MSPDSSSNLSLHSRPSEVKSKYPVKHLKAFNLFTNLPKSTEIFIREITVWPSALAGEGVQLVSDLVRDVRVVHNHLDTMV